jgi:hypothetical protein
VLQQVEHVHDVDVAEPFFERRADALQPRHGDRAEVGERERRITRRHAALSGSYSTPMRYG